MPRTPADPRRRIGTLNEKPLHAALKEWYREPGDLTETPVDGFLVDLVRGDLLIEIQTGNLGAVRRKLQRLAQGHRVRLVYPIAERKWIVRMSQEGDRRLGRRRSPRRGALHDVFEEMVSLPQLLALPGVSLEVLMIHEEEVRRYDPQRAWRRRHWVVQERRLLEVLHGYRFETTGDLRALLPRSLQEPFTTADLAEAVDSTRRRAQQMAYCLRTLGEIVPTGRRRAGILYRRATA
ncbi:MAG: hypothetical protein GXY85_00180 [Candidatus Brocadiaceae bacterium]|nr:hypothetical protein [Candidatus Brocadiaceae bacterium]